MAERSRKDTERNIYRDLKDLDAAGFSITFDRENNTYRFTL